MPYKFRDIEKRLLRLGFSLKRKGKGSHMLFSDGRNTFSVPKHSGKDISPGVEQKIVKSLNMSKDEFRNIL